LLQRTIAAALFCLLFAPGAFAHAILVSSDPAAGASVAAGTVDLTFRYNSRIDRDRSRLTLTGPDHSQLVLTIVPSAEPNVLEATPILTTPGDYVVRWQVLAVDGHITRGDVAFTVKGH
jgi:methionine-rich copper-binding protein CopC